MHFDNSAMSIRKPNDTDYTKIYHILDRAFAPSIAESNLVRSLKNAEKIRLDLVMEQQERILGYICYSAAFDRTRTVIGYHLAPLAVLPEKQRQGLGHQLTRKSLRLLSGALPIYVLGDPEYYRRFGFRIDKTQKCRFDPEGGHFMVLSAGPLPARDVLYEEEFYELG
jgi:putative acetyltransferase